MNTIGFGGHRLQHVCQNHAFVLKRAGERRVGGIRANRPAQDVDGIDVLEAGSEGCDVLVGGAYFNIDGFYTLDPYPEQRRSPAGHRAHVGTPLPMAWTRLSFASFAAGPASGQARSPASGARRHSTSAVEGAAAAQALATEMARVGTSRIKKSLASSGVSPVRMRCMPSLTVLRVIRMP